MYRNFYPQYGLWRPVNSAPQSQWVQVSDDERRHLEELRRQTIPASSAPFGYPPPSATYYPTPPTPPAPPAPPAPSPPYSCACHPTPQHEPPKLYSMNPSERMAEEKSQAALRTITEELERRRIWALAEEAKEKGRIKGHKNVWRVPRWIG